MIEIQKEIINHTINENSRKIREKITDTTRLSLAGHIEAERIKHNITIEVEDNLPSALSDMNNIFNDPFVQFISRYLTDIKNLKNSSGKLKEMVRKTCSFKEQWNTNANEWEQHLRQTHELSSEILRFYEQRIDGILRIIYASNEDVLGAYFPPRTHRSQHNTYIAEGPGQIKIYWKPIQIIANKLDVPLESLTIVVLIHELVHGYTHLGFDSDGHIWKSYPNLDREICEGTAQYFTDHITQILGIRDVRNAYEKLLEIQPLPYHVHIEWINNKYGKETVRDTIIRCRAKEITTIHEFNERLRKCRNALKTIEQ